MSKTGFTAIPLLILVALLVAVLALLVIAIVVFKGA